MVDVIDAIKNFALNVIFMREQQNQFVINAIMIII